MSVPSGERVFKIGGQLFGIGEHIAFAKAGKYAVLGQQPVESWATCCIVSPACVSAVSKWRHVHGGAR